MATENQVLLYQTEDGETRLEVLHEDETVWLSQRDMAQLFQVTVPTINAHIKNIYAEGELQQGSTIKHFITSQKEGGRIVTRNLIHYNLDMVISVGYRVRAKVGIQFRKWATQRLKEFFAKSFAMGEMHKMLFIISKETIDDKVLSMEIPIKIDIDDYENLPKLQAPYGYIYIIQDVEVTGRYKIGRTNHPKRRMLDFGVRLPFEIKLIHIIITNDVAELEHRLHQQFADCRRSGEWFELNEAQVADLMKQKENIP